MEEVHVLRSEYPLEENMAEIRILVVDDEEIARLSLSQILRLEGYAVRSVESGEIALNALQEISYDLMILDLKMPGMNGMEVLRRVIKDFPQVRVIVLTAYGSMDTAIQALRNHAHDYLLKPARPGQIVETVERVLKEPAWSAARPEQMGPPGDSNATSRFVDLPSGAVMDWNRRLINWQNYIVLLTPTEIKVLEALYQKTNQVVSHSDLVFGVQGYELDAEEAANILRPVMSRLRQKLSVIPGGKDWIQTIRGAGYILEIGEAKIPGEEN
jgi:DNA-binding response OmpR family regulator